MRRVALTLPVFIGCLLAITPVSAQSQIHADSTAASASPAFFFAGVTWGTPTATVKERFSAQGFTFTKTDPDGDIWFQGQLLGYRTQVLAFQANGKLVKVIVSLATPDLEAISTFTTMERILAEKYGNPNDRTRSFTSPYSLGDGNELQAIRLGKAMIRDRWTHGDENAGTLHGMGLRIANDLTVHVFYESPEWFVEQQRRERASSSVF